MPAVRPLARLALGLALLGALPACQAQAPATSPAARLAPADRPIRLVGSLRPLARRLAAIGPYALADVGSLTAELRDDDGVLVDDATIAGPISAASRIGLDGLRPNRTYTVTLKATGTGADAGQPISVDGGSVTTVSTLAVGGIVPDQIDQPLTLKFADREVRLVATLPLDLPDGVAVDEVEVEVTDDLDAPIVSIVGDANRPTVAWTPDAQRSIKLKDLRPGQQYKVTVRGFEADAEVCAATYAFQAPALTDPMDPTFSLPELALLASP